MRRIGLCRVDCGSCTVDDRNVYVDDDHFDHDIIDPDRDSSIMPGTSSWVHPDRRLGAAVVNRCD